MSTFFDIQIVNGPAEYMSLQDDEAHAGGGECVFFGRTRAEVHPGHGRLVRLSYEVYQPLAEHMLMELANRAAVQFECLAVRIHHAVGEVPPGEASVIVQTLCGHRAEAFDACRMLIDRLKVEVPIWKKEVWEDGTTWSQGTRLATADETAGGGDST